MSSTVASGSTSYARDPRTASRCTARPRSPSTRSGQFLAERTVDAAAVGSRVRATRRAVRSDRRRAARPPSRADRSTTVTSCPRCGGDPGRLQPGRTAAEHDDAPRRGGGRVPVGILGLAPARRLTDARHDRVADVADLARLVAAGARPDLVGVRHARPSPRGRGRRSGPASSRPRRTPAGSS